MSNYVKLHHEIDKLQSIPFEQRTPEQTARMKEIYPQLNGIEHDHIKILPNGDTVFIYDGKETNRNPAFVPPPLLPFLPERGGGIEDWREWVLTVEAYVKQAEEDHKSRGGDVADLDRYSLMGLQKVLSPEHGGWWASPRDPDGLPNRILRPGFEWYKSPFGWIQRRL